MLSTTKPKLRIGPDNHGQKMSLKAYEFVRTVPVYHYELSRGYITVSEVANYVHALLVATVRDYLIAHKLLDPQLIHIVLTSMKCKLLIPGWKSERHPDIAVYLTPPKGPKNRKLWRTWIPEFVIEVVSERSVDRNYVEKREEYWTLGVKAYWIVDAQRRLVVLLRRGKSDWIEDRLGPGDVCTTRLLPGFQMPCDPVFDLAARAEEEAQ